MFQVLQTIDKATETPGEKEGKKRRNDGSLKVGQDFLAFKAPRFGSKWIRCSNSI